MIPSQVLREKLNSIDGKDYAACQALLGEYNFKQYSLILQQIPKDPYAPPHTGIYRIQLSRSDKHVINRQVDSKVAEIAFRDFLTRNFYQACLQISKGRRGTGNSGIITINEPGQIIIERNCVVLTAEMIEVRCFIGLPADGRAIKADIAVEMIFGELPEIISRSLFADNVDQDALDRHINTAEDAHFLRDRLPAKNLVAFIADEAILPRESGSSDKPLQSAQAVPFRSPENLRVEFKLPHAGKIKGMGIPGGITLIAGGGYHGKSTLLQALQAGIYNHIPGDGRELCVSLEETVKIRAYSGRYIIKTDISPFIRNLPFRKDTSAFSTENASGSTSQAAGIIEAIETGAKVLLMDEDTCATNFMIRDQKMQQLVHKEDEPITTFIDRVRLLYHEKNISTILVLGGAGDYFEVSDIVIQLNSYIPGDVTEKAKKIAGDSPVKRIVEDSGYPYTIRERVPLPESIDPHNEFGKKGIYAKEVFRLVFGKSTVDLTDLEQLVELSQTKAIGFAIEYARRYMDGNATLREIVIKVNDDIDQHGLDILSDRISGNFARFRSFELAFALNRLRGFDVSQRLK